MKALPEGVCPACSRLASPERDLLDDILVSPVITFKPAFQTRSGTVGPKWRIIGCLHVRDIFGPYDDEDAAKAAVAARFGELRAIRERDREQLRRALNHEKAIQPETDLLRPAETVDRMDEQRSGSLWDESECLADLASVRSEDYWQQRRATETSLGAGAQAESSQSVSQGAGDAAVAGAPACRIGARINMRHSFDLSGRCECGWQMPKLL